MGSYLLDSYALFRIVAHHSLKEVPEMVVEVSVGAFPRMRLPEYVEFLLLDELIVGIVDCCFLKWRVASVHDEQDDA